MTQRFDWDFAKAAANLRKHGVSFEEAASGFLALLKNEWVTGREG